VPERSGDRLASQQLAQAMDCAFARRCHMVGPSGREREPRPLLAGSARLAQHLAAGIDHDEEAATLAAFIAAASARTKA
jgi:hypothetical protein